jgi:hypothetical protein
MRFVRRLVIWLIYWFQTVFCNHTPQSLHWALLHPLNPTLTQAVHSVLLPSLSRATTPTPFHIMIGQTTRMFYFRWLTK